MPQMAGPDKVTFGRGSRWTLKPRSFQRSPWGSNEEGEEAQYVVVLEIPPVDSVETGAKVAIAAEGRKRAGR